MQVFTTTDEHRVAPRGAHPLPPSLAGAVALACALCAAPVAAQEVALFDSLPGARGLTSRGEGGFTGGSVFEFQPLVGDLGRSVAFVDANGDGYDDLLVGAPLLPANPALVNMPPQNGVSDEAGHAYLIFGGPDLGLPGTDAEIDFGALTAGMGIDYIGTTGSRTGVAVAAAGDVNDDGIDDFLIGAPRRSQGGKQLAGGAWLVFGDADLGVGPTTRFLSGQVSSGAAVYLRGPRAFAQAGWSLAGGFDANGDGIDDLAIGAPYDSVAPLTNNGSAFVVYGSPALELDADGIIDLATGLGAGEKTEVRGSNSFDLLGFSVAGLGNFDPVLPDAGGLTDLDGADVAIGSPGASPGGKLLAGAAYVLRGVPSGTPPALLWESDDFDNTVDGAGNTWTGAAAGDQAGWRVGDGGDLLPEGGANGTAFTDLVICAPFSDRGGKPDRGVTYLVPGTLMGANPTGYDLSLAGTGGAPGSVAVLGRATGEGLLGLVALSGGDWNGDGRDDLLMGTPALANLNANQQILAEGGRIRVLNGVQLVGTVDMDFPPPNLDLVQYGGETPGSWVGASVAAGDMNGDGDPDFGVGGPGAPSSVDALDPSGIAHLKTGRGHAVYGPTFRLGNVDPDEIFFGGPNVELEVFNLVAPFEVSLISAMGRIPVTVADFTTGANGAAELVVPMPAIVGETVDLEIDSALGVSVSEDVLTFLELDVTSGPTPAKGLPGQTIAFGGVAFNDTLVMGLPDTEVFIDGFPMTVSSVDVGAGTMNVLLGEGPALDTPLDILIRNSNGEVELEDAFTYKTVMITDVSPTSGSAESGIIDTNIPTGFKGVPVVEVELTLDSSILPPADLSVELRVADGEFEEIPFTLAGDTVTIDMPSALAGDVEQLVDFRVTDTTGTDTAEDAFTYGVSDYEERPEYAGGGFGPTPPRIRMAGSFSPATQVVTLIETSSTVIMGAFIFVSLDELVPPQPLGNGSGALVGFDPGSPFFSVFLGAIPAGPFGIQTNIQMGIDPASDGVPLFLQLATVENDGSGERMALSNLLIATIDIP